MNVTLTLTIGLNSNRTLAPLPAARSAAFVGGVSSLAHRIGVVYADAAPHDGSWVDDATGVTVHEAARTFVVGTTADKLPALRSELAALCVEFEQDAIALTVGATELAAPVLAA